MKNEKHLSSASGLRITLWIPAAAIMIFMVASGSRPADSFNTEENIAASQQALLSAGDDSVYVEVDEMPVFPEGDNALLKFIATNTKYPEEAKKNKITGKVIVRFVVRKDCSVSDVGIVQGVNQLIDAEAIRVVSSLPKFQKPGKKDGKIVSTYFMIPITFALK